MKYILPLLILFLVIFLTGCTDSTPVENDIAITTGGQSNDTTTLPSSQTLTVSEAELVSHNKETDCWIAYQGNVYDVTDYVPIHPGGAAQIVPLCGTSGKFEDAFTMKHGTSKVSVLEKQGIYKGKLV
jgi:cytochrome b involved in lipid metabolism